MSDFPRARARGWQRLEGAGIAFGGIVIAGIAAPGGPWWAWVLALLAPDIGMLGYVINRRIGALSYNILHIYASPFLVMMLGVALGSTFMIAGGALCLAHIGIDRALGYGLKLETGFRDTHLGRIGQDAGK